ncbi:MAG: nitrate transporter substrate-binding protein [Acidimicrobiales bacterium]|nr:nitrate transporter substrate-binding protein [Acidimicrobiales bacterium]
MNRKLGALALAFLTVTMLAACGSTKASTTSSGKPKVSLMVGGLNKQIYLPFTLAKQLGYYDKYGIGVTLNDEPAGVDAETAMLAGQVNGVGGFYDHTIDLQTKGKQTQSVIQLLRAPGEVELCRTDLKGEIRSASDWSGRKLGVTGLGSSTNFLTKALAVHAGVAVDKVTPIAVQAGNTFIAAMQHKAIDCGMTTEPTITAVLQKHLGYVLTDMRSMEGTRQVLGGTYPSTSVYMQTDWVNNNRDTVQRLVNALVDTLHFIQNHTAAQIADQMPPDYYTGVGKAAYVKALDAEKAIYSPDGVMPADGPKTVYDVLSQFNPSMKGKTADLNATFTTAFVQQAVKDVH